MSSNIERPTRGGAWVRDPKTGKLKPAAKADKEGTK